MQDPLAQYRKTPLAAAGGSGKTSETDEYVAFAGKDRAMRLRIRRAMAPTHAPTYANLANIVYDGPYGTNFVLYYGYLMVMVRGRNLQAMIHGLENHMVDYIQEFDPDRWEKPKDEKTAFIESIEVVVPESASAIPGAEKAADVRH